MVLGEELGGLYVVNPDSVGTPFSDQYSSFPYSIAALSLSDLWHYRLGHPSSQHMCRIQGLPCKAPSSICSICPQAKQHRTSFSSSVSSISRPFDLLHVDIWGPYRTTTYDGYKLFLSIVDDFSRGTWIFLLSHKSNALHMLQSFITYVETQFSTRVKVI